MDKLVYALWRREQDTSDELSRLLRLAVGPELLEIGAGSVQVNVADAAVEDRAVRVAGLHAPVDAVASVWVPDGEANAPAVTARLGAITSRLAGWLVSEAVPLEPPAWPQGERHPGVANMAFLQRPETAGSPSWPARWQGTPETVGCIENTVTWPVTADAPAVDAIVEELFPVEAALDLDVIYGSGGDGAVDVVPTSRYVLGPANTFPAQSRTGQ
jgi:hypothetical protein